MKEEPGWACIGSVARLVAWAAGCGSAQTDLRKRLDRSEGVSP